MLGFCSECPKLNSGDDCPADEFCTELLGLGLFGLRCDKRKELGEFCIGSCLPVPGGENCLDVDDACLVREMFVIACKSFFSFILFLILPLIEWDLRPRLVSSI